MPFVHLRWRPGTFDEAAVVRIRDAVASASADILTEVDPEHIVTDPMVDLRVEPIGTLDRVRGDLFITLLARDEPARQENRRVITSRLEEAVRRLAGDAEVTVELVLTQHTSSFDYATLEDA